MTQGERLLIFILGVIVCSFLSCSLSIIAHENSAFLSGRQPLSSINESWKIGSKRNQTSISTSLARFWARVKSRASVDDVNPDNKTLGSGIRGLRPTGGSVLAGMSWFELGKMVGDSFKAVRTAITQQITSWTVVNYAIENVNTVAGRGEKSIWMNMKTSIQSAQKKISSYMRMNRVRMRGNQGTSWGGRDLQGLAEKMRVANMRREKRSIGETVRMMLAGLVGVIMSVGVGLGVMTVVKRGHESTARFRYDGGVMGDEIEENRPEDAV